MTDLIDIVGLNELAAGLRRAPAIISSARLEGAAEFANVELWSQRSRFQMILEEREAWLAAAANDLGLRAAGMESAEAVAQTLGRVFDSDNAFYRCMLRGDGYELVREALERIQDLLRTDGRRYFFFSRGDTSVSEQEIRESIEIVLDLAPAVLRAVLAGMAGMLIEKWLAKLDDHDIEPELLRDLFDHVARGAAGTQLGTMALLSDETSHRYLIDAIGSETSDERQYWAFRTVVGAIGDSEGQPTTSGRPVGGHERRDAGDRATALRWARPADGVREFALARRGALRRWVGRLYRRIPNSLRRLSVDFLGSDNRHDRQSRSEGFRVCGRCACSRRTARQGVRACRDGLRYALDTSIRGRNR